MSPITSPRRRKPRSQNAFRTLPSLETFEPRQLLAAGPLTATITEVETGQTLTLTDNNALDTNLNTGTLSYSSTVGSSTFTDFNLDAFSAISNRTTATTVALLDQLGTIERTTSTGGTRTLRITISDTGFTNPSNPQTLYSTASVTFTNPTSSDSAAFQSFANSTASPIVTLTPNLANNPDSQSGSATPTPLSIPSPYNLSNTYTIVLGANTAGSPPVTVNFQNTGISRVVGTNNVNNAQISGTVFHDANQNIPNPNLAGDQGLSGITVTLSGKDINGNPVSATTTTDQNGFYQFTGLPASSSAGYTITEGAVPSPYIHEGQAPGSTGGTTGNRTITTILPAGGNSTNNNFGEVLPSSLTGIVYCDGNEAGRYVQGEKTIGMVTLTLTNASGQVVATTMSNANGVYSFPNIIPGTYTITETQPTNYIPGTDTPGSLGGTAGTDVITTIPVKENQNGTGYNFGNNDLPAKGFLQGTVFKDVNGDGKNSVNDPGLAGATVTLFARGSTTPITSTTTDANGNYLFSNLAPGNYTLVEIPPAASGLISSGTQILSQFNPASSASVNSINVTVVDPNQISATLVGQYAADNLPIVYNGTTFNASVGQEKLSLSGPGVANAGVAYPTFCIDLAHLVSTGNTYPLTPGSTLSTSAVNAGAIASLYNHYGSTVLTSGDQAAALQIAIWELEYDQVSASTGRPTGGPFMPGSGVSSSILCSAANYVLQGLGETEQVAFLTVSDCATSTGRQGMLALDSLNFATTQPGTITGTVFRDTTGNGLTSDDPTFGSTPVTITLTNTATGATQTTTSSVAPGSANGTFAFTNLLPGTYTVAETVPAGYTETAPYPSTYTVTTGIGTTSPNNNFDNFQQCTGSTITNVSYTVVHGCTTTTYSSLGGNVQPGDKVTANFTISGSTSQVVTLVSYVAPTTTLSSQYISAVTTGSYAPGPHSISVVVPPGNFQVDFVCGPPIDHFGPNGSNITYHAEQRFIDAANGYPGWGSSQKPFCFLGDSTDIGSPGQPGTLSVNASGVYTIQGGGSDIWNNSDQFNYDYQTLSGDGELIAKVDSISNTDPWAKAGLMIRSSLAANSAQAMIVTTPGNGVAFQGRTTDGACSFSQGAGWGTAPVWLKIVRSGSQITGYESGNGINWTQVGTASIAIGQNAYIGLAVTAHNNSLLATAQFEHVSTSDFWANCDGQNLINSFGGCSTSTCLANALSYYLPNLYGSSAGLSSLYGKTNADVAALAARLWAAGDLLDYETLALALDVYATTSGFGGSTASGWGFDVDCNGFGNETVNLWGASSILGFSNSSQAVNSILFALNNKASNGTISLGGSSQSATVVSALDSILEACY